MVLARVGHREQLGELAPVAGDEPVLVIRDLALGPLFLHEVRDDLDDKVFRQDVQVQLGGMRDPDARQ